MNLLFLTLSKISSIEQHGIYTDILRKFCDNGHNVYIISPIERRNNENTYLIDQENCKILRVKTGNIQKTNIIEKGISTVLLENQFISVIKKYFSNVKFDLVLYSTPPITLAGAVKYIKKRDNARTYLLLKDIFPQNAVDIGMMTKTGLKSIIYRYFRNKEKQLYNLSDKIGCMSTANVDYVLKHNPEIKPEKVEVCPNSIEPIDLTISDEEKLRFRKKYNIPLDKKVFIYGGNLGRPQGIPFLIECLRANINRKDCFFVVCGTGTEYKRLEEFYNSQKPDNILLINGLPKEEYDKFVLACDVGMIFLDHRFEIPNFPSRLLSYMQAKMPVIACTDPNTDIGQVIKEGGFGWWCESNSAVNFTNTVNDALNSDLNKLGQNAYDYLIKNYTTEIGYNIIVRSFD